MERLKAYLKENYRSLLGSFMLALILWVSISSEKVYTTQIRLPFKVNLGGDSLTLVRKIPEDITLRIKGTGRMLFGLNFRDKSIHLNIPDIKKTKIIDLTEQKQNLHFPSEYGMEILSVISPRRILVEVDKKIERKLPVKVEHHIQTVPGYLFVSQQVHPDSVRVRGPQKLVSKLTAISTDSIIMKDAKYPFTSTVHFISPRPGIIFITPEKGQVTTTIEPIVERTLYNVPIQLVNFPPDLQAVAEPAMISVRVKGGETRVTRLRTDEISVIFDYKLSFHKGVMEYPMQIVTPADITWLEVVPQKFVLQLIQKGNTL